MHDHGALLYPISRGAADHSGRRRIGARVEVVRLRQRNGPSCRARAGFTRRGRGLLAEGGVYSPRARISTERSRISTLRTLPVTVIGNSSTIWTYLGIL